MMKKPIALIVINCYNLVTFELIVNQKAGEKS